MFQNGHRRCLGSELCHYGPESMQFFSFVCFNCNCTVLLFAATYLLVMCAIVINIFQEICPNIQRVMIKNTEECSSWCKVYGGEILVQKCKKCKPDHRRTVNVGIGVGIGVGSAAVLVLIGVGIGCGFRILRKRRRRQSNYLLNILTHESSLYWDYIELSYLLIDDSTEYDRLKEEGGEEVDGEESVYRATTTTTAEGTSTGRLLGR